MEKVDRDLLLGYLMNALEEDELSLVERELMRQPDLRCELAELQKELSPLTFVYESVDPPKNLARRTCDKIWASVDQEEKAGRYLVGPESPTQQIVSISISSKQVSSLPSFPTFFARSSKTTKLVSSKKANLSENSTVETAKSVAVPSEAKSDDRRLVRRRPTSGRVSRHSIEPSEVDASPNHSDRRRRWLDIVVSASVGILIAVMAFPAINFAKGRTEQLITQSKIKELNQNVGLYTPIPSGTPTVVLPEEPRGVNLAYSGWQEVKPAQLPLLTVGSNSRLAVSSAPSSYPFPMTPSSATFFSPVSEESPIFRASGDRDIVLGQAPERLEQAEMDPRGLSYQTLLSSIGSTATIGNGATVQTAFGQNVLFQNDRIFFRVLPVFEVVPHPSLDNDAPVEE